MKPDGTDSFSIVDEKSISPKDIHVTGQEFNSGPEVVSFLRPGETTWSYLFVHHCKVKGMEAQLIRDGVTYFVHKSVRYFRKQGRSKVQHQQIPTVSGLVFFRGRPEETQAYLNDHFPNTYLCKNCSTGRVAEIPEEQMRPFMRLNQMDPERIRFLLKPFHYYARNRVLLRITSGLMAGLEGYVIRIDRDRRLVMDIGGISVAIAGVHAEHFEEVEPQAPSAATPFYQRNLHEREALIDRYFHPVTSASEVAAQAASIDYLREYVLAALAREQMDFSQAWHTCAFIIREIGYYYAPLVDQAKGALAPIMAQGARVIQEMQRLADSPHLDTETSELHKAALQELMTQYAYLF